MSLRLLDSIHEEVKLISKEEGFSINQFIASAVAEKMSALKTEKYLVERAKKGNEKAFLEAMAKVPGVAPVDQD